MFAVLASAGLEAQDYGARLGVQRGGAVSFEPRGPGVVFGALDPTVKKWYVPQELYFDYQWQQWEYSNYARDSYQRYVNTRIRGDYFYDSFGDYINFGWLIYDWRQDQPLREGSSIFKSRNFNGFFSNITVSGDQRGQYAYAITVGNDIRTTLTPMTFSKPRFNGVQVDFASDKYSATILASRISDPVIGSTETPRKQTNLTRLVGGRATAQVGDFITLGATLVDARNANTALDMFDGNFIAGNLTAGQSGTPVTAIAIVLSDDSPEDGEGGAALFGHDLRITSKNFETGLETEHSLAEVVRSGAEWPAVFGGFAREGFVSADGTERIVLNYDFTDPAYIGPDLTSVIDVEFDYLIANDYHIQMWSNRQTGRTGEGGVPAAPLTSEVIDEQQPVLFTVERAEGNIKDISNVRVVEFDYGLPTANLVGGFTIEGTGFLGFDFYGEWDRNVRYSQYPNAARFSANKGHEISSRSGDATIFTIERHGYPYFAFAELYSVDQDYSTSTFASNTAGDFRYDFPSGDRYEFVDDNDDQDRIVDWARKDTPGEDSQVFPGWDENNDFVSDFNQNDTGLGGGVELPDYEEPFLRHDVDRPEFLFGIDLNNNAWIDRFEDDDLPDYPYKADRQGYNVFGGMNLTPEARVFIGRVDEKMFSDDREHLSTYGLFTFDKEYAGLGRVRVFDMFKRTKDTIPDARRAPSPSKRAPIQPVVEDILPAPDTWINSAWVGFDYTAIPKLDFINKLKYEFHNQSGAQVDIDGRPLDPVANLFGLVNKVEYTLELGNINFLPRLKSEFLRQDAFAKEDDDREHWMTMGALLTQVPVLRQTTITAGVELARFSERVTDEEQMIEDKLAGETGDFRSAIFAFQLSTNSPYLGYHLTTQFGFRVGRTSRELIQQTAAAIPATDAAPAVPAVYGREREAGTETTSFITIYAGVE